MRRKYIITAFVLVTLVLVFLFLKTADDVEGPGFGASLSNLTEERARWSTLIQKTGATKAFEEFVSTYSDKHFYLQHLAAHLFGELVFLEEGISGWTGCGDDFFYGCYHGFFARAVGERGEELISRLDELCGDVKGKSKDDCYHGIGHGLLEHMGRHKLGEVLRTCSVIEGGVSCLRGAFMEYNTPFIIEGNAFLMKGGSFNPEKPYEPCDVISSEFKTTCYYELGWRWEGTLGGDYERMESLCGGIHEEHYRKSCFEGVGRMAVLTSNHSVKETLSKCGNNRDCLIGALHSFQNSPGHREKSEEIAEALRKL